MTELNKKKLKKPQKAKPKKNKAKPKPPKKTKAQKAKKSNIVINIKNDKQTNEAQGKKPFQLPSTAILAPQRDDYDTKHIVNNQSHNIKQLENELSSGKQFINTYIAKNKKTDKPTEPQVEPLPKQSTIKKAPVKKKQSVDVKLSQNLQSSFKKEVINKEYNKLLYNELKKLGTLKLKSSKKNNRWRIRKNDFRTRR
jgi:hypothetical protein